MGKGYFIALEGLDGAGTTTQLAALGTYFVLKGKEFVPLCTREPTMLTPEGREIRRILGLGLEGINWRERYNERHMAGLYVADRRWHVENLIKPVVDAGGIAISDRHMLSTLAYQSIDGIPLDELVAMHDGIMAPDLTVYLDVRAEEAYRRITQTRTEAPERYEAAETLMRVEKAYKTAIERVRDTQHVVIVDGEPEGETLEKKIEKTTSNIVVEVDKLFA